MEHHREDLNGVRLNFDSTTSQMTANHNSALEDLRKEHETALESLSHGFEKQISKLSLELKATQDDLAKTKAAYEASKSSIASLTDQRDQARASLASTPTTSPEAAEELVRLTTELSHTKDDLQASNEILALTKESLTEMSKKHSQELEDAAKERANELTKLRATHDEDITTFAREKSDLQIKLSDLEGEISTLKATLAAEQPAPKSNGVPAPPQSPGVTKEELARMHEAHNLKIGDLTAEHEKAMKALVARLEASESSVEQARQEVMRKAMEMDYMEKEREEDAEQIKAYVSLFFP